jgi:ribosomal protein S18 acetylase RimI-like enzyme
MGLTLHIALKVSLGDVLSACDALRAHAVTPLSFFGTETEEPSVLGWMPAAAVYFRDPDGHLVEYLAMLREPARPERGIVAWSDWASADPRLEAVHVERHTGPRAELQALFEEAEDSGAELDAYIEMGEVLVAATRDRLVGHLQLIDVAPETTEIKNMAVDARFRRRGIGRMLIEEAVAVTRRRGRTTLTVATATADTENLRFYQRLGFRMRTVERDAFTAATGYPPGLMIDGIKLQDRIWLDLDLDVDCAQQ